MLSSVFTTHSLFQPSGPSNVARDSSVNKTFEKLSSTFRRSCTRILVNGAVVTGFTNVPTFFRRHHRFFFSKSSPQFIPGFFHRLTFNPWQRTLKTTLEWLLSTLLLFFVGAITNLYTIRWYLPLILDVSNNDLPFASSVVITHFSVKNVLLNYTMIIWNTEVSCYSCKWLQFVYTCAEPKSFYPARAYNCSHHSVKISLSSNL